MTPEQIERLRRAEALFEGALELPSGPPREAYLEREAVRDPESVDIVRGLLMSDEQLSACAPPPAALPTFGAWQAIRVLGRGGMGVVYLAERADGAFRMLSAVKVVPLTLALNEMEERFRRERQFLAALEHPGIARLLDGGVTSTGLSYLVMEYVDGMPIDGFCDAHHLDTRERVGLIRQVLEALAYVHSRQVIHRDLKASNILVTAEGKVKLLDFGTARLIDTGGNHAITQAGVFAFTPEYASPEQAEGKPLTFSSDIYSAGVLLYKLLVGRAPYRLPDDQTAHGDAIRRAKPEPSRLEAPLDAILSTALQKDPAKRYPSAAGLDADLARYLDGQRVHAHRPAKLAMFVTASIAAILIGVAAAFLLFRWADSRRTPAVAVLPFADDSSSSEKRYLSSGLRETIAESLARFRRLRVMTPASIAQFQKSGAPGASSVLECRVEGAGDPFRISVKLTRLADRTVLWSAMFDRPASDLAAVEWEIVAGIARTLNLESRSQPGHLPKPDAFDLMMKARYEAQQLTPEALAQAEADARRAIKLDPEYAEAYLTLGIQKYNEATAKGSLQTDEERSTAEQMFHRTLDLRPDLGSARAGLANIAMQYDWDWKRAERELRLATAGTPNVTVEQSYAYLLIFQQRFNEADEHIGRSQDLDPFSTAAMMNVGALRNLEGRFEEARGIAQRVAAVYPNVLSAQLMIAGSYVQQNRPELAMQVLTRLDQNSPSVQMWEAMADAKAGQRAPALRLIARYEASYPDLTMPAQWLALVYAYMNDEAGTVKWLGRSIDRHEWGALNLGVNPAYGAMRRSAAFQALRKRIGLVP